MILATTTFKYIFVLLLSNQTITYSQPLDVTDCLEAMKRTEVREEGPVIGALCLDSRRFQLALDSLSPEEKTTLNFKEYKVPKKQEKK